MNELLTHPVTAIVILVVLSAIIVAITIKVMSDRRKKDAREASRVQEKVERQLVDELRPTPPKPRHRGTRAVRPAPAAQRVRRVSTPVSTPTVRSRDANDDLSTFIIPATTFIVADTLYPDPTPSNNDPAPSPSYDPSPSPSPSYDSGSSSSSYDSGSSSSSSDSGGSFGGGDSGSF